MITMAASVSSRPSSSSQLNECGATAVEYGLLITGIAAVIAVALFLFGGAVLALFTGTCDVVMSLVGGTC